MKPAQPSSSHWLLPGQKALRAILAATGFSGAWIDRLAAVSREAWSNDWSAWQEEMGRLMTVHSGEVMPTKGFEWQLLALAQRMEGVTKQHALRGIDPSISAATVADLVRWANSIDRKPRRDRALPLQWFRNHVERNLLEIGCLQFVPGPHDALFRVFCRADGSGEPVALARGEIPCDPEGWPVEGDSAFVTTYARDSSGFYGHPLLPETGAILPDTVTLPVNAWQPVFAPGDTVLQVHIPEGAELSTEGCRDAFLRAEAIYRESFPEIPWRVFHCTTWMLDPALDGLLDPGSRIRTFASLFRRATIRNPNGRQIMERVLDSSPDWRKFEPRTSLQRKVCAHLRAGGIFRTSGGYRVPKIFNRNL